MAKEKNEAPPAPAEETTEKPQRVEVGFVQFLHPYDGAGVSGAPSGLTSKELRRDSKHTIAYLPRVQMFEITHHPRDQDFVEIDLVPLASVKRWRRLSDWRALGK